jgi:hypothetical protein
MHMRNVLAICALLLGAFRMDAAAIQAGIWYNIQGFATGPMSGGVNGVGYSAPGAGPWTFTLIGNGTLEVTDAQTSGDSYTVFNFGNPLNTSPTNGNFTGQGVIPPSSCGLDPLACFLDSDFANETFALVGGTGTNFSLSFNLLDVFQGGDAFFRVNGTLTTPSGTTTGGGTPPVDPPVDPPTGGEIPEPSTYALVGSAIAYLAWKRRKS